MQVAILAGGLATRLGDLTRNQPKSTLKIQGKAFLEYQLELLRGGGVKNIIFCIGYMGGQIEKHFGNGSNTSTKCLSNDKSSIFGLLQEQLK